MGNIPTMSQGGPSKAIRLLWKLCSSCRNADVVNRFVSEPPTHPHLPPKLYSIPAAVQYPGCPLFQKKALVAAHALVRRPGSSSARTHMARSALSTSVNSRSNRALSPQDPQYDADRVHQLSFCHFGTKEVRGAFSCPLRRLHDLGCQTLNRS
jgi:hypothetical protein